MFATLCVALRGCELIARATYSVAVCSAKEAIRDAAFAERKATVINSQPLRATEVSKTCNVKTEPSGSDSLARCK
jgi:hypothetical protein